MIGQEMIYEKPDYFPEEHFSCFRNTNAPSSLIVRPCSGSKINLIDWANHNQVKIAQAIKEFGAIVFSGFNLTNKKDFYDAFTAITGKPPEARAASPAHARLRIERLKIGTHDSC